MAVRTTWQDKYCIEQTSSLTAKPTFADTAVGIEGTGTAGGKFLIPLTEHPHLPPQTSTNDQELAVGLAERYHLEYNQTVAEPSTVTLSMPANAYNVSLFIWLLLQTGCTEDSAGDPVVLTGIPYTESSIEIYSAITRILGGTSGSNDQVSQYLRGAICRSLTLSGETGGLITLSAEMVAADWETANNDLGTTNWADLTFSNKPPLKFQDMNFLVENNAVTTSSFSVTITNNAGAQFYNNSTIQRFTLGRLGIEGNFQVSWADTNYGSNSALTDFINGTQKQLDFYWGSQDGSVDNSISITINAIYSDTNMGDSEGELITEVNFSGVKGSAEEALNFICSYQKTLLVRGIP